jgi:hypothetical protein
LRPWVAVGVYGRSIAEVGGELGWLKTAAPAPGTLEPAA